MGNKVKLFLARKRKRKHNNLEKARAKRAMLLQAKRSAHVSTNDSTGNEKKNEDQFLELECHPEQGKLLETPSQLHNLVSISANYEDKYGASTSSTAPVSSGDLFVEVPPTTVLEAEGPDASKEQPPSDKEEVIEEPKPLPKLRQRRPPIPATMSTRSTLRVTEADKEQLAMLVRGHPVLYDPRYLHFKDKAQTHYAWQDISRTMLRTESECISIWKILKESYKAAVRRRKLRMNQGLLVKPAKYEAFMSFVKPFLIKTRAAAAEPPSGGAAPELVGAAPGLEGAALAADPTRSGAFPAQPQRNKFVEFFRNLGETVKDFPTDVKDRVKNEVLKVVSDAREFVLSNTSVEQLFVVEDIKEEPLDFESQ